jgi:hypothetical protein
MRLRLAGGLAKSAFAMLAGLAAVLQGSQAAADVWPANVRAQYEVSFNGFHIGNFEFEAQAESQSYTLSVNAQLSVLLGAFTWAGETRTFGLIEKEAPKPAAFTFDFRSTAKTGSMKMGFSEGAVTNVVHLPPEAAKPGTVPVREQHLKNVLDPLSAILVVTRGSGASACDRRLPIFDGKERFDLVLSHKGQIRVNEQQPSGQPGIAHVCRVRYVPIAGHKSDIETKFMANSDSIEVALRPVPSANVLVPYQISIPTLLGTINIASKRVEIASPGRPQIALLH